MATEIWTEPDEGREQEQWFDLAEIEDHDSPTRFELWLCIRESVGESG